MGLNLRRSFDLDNVDRIFVNAGNGNDLAEISSAVRVPAQRFGEGGNDTLVGGAAADRIEGSAGNDILRGNDGQDTLLGGECNGQLFVGGGNDKTHAGGGQGSNGNGFDIDFDDSVLSVGTGRGNANIRVFADNDGLVLRIRGQEGRRLTHTFDLGDVDCVSIDAGNGNDVINLSGVNVRAVIRGGAGNDNITGGSAAV